MYMLCKLFVNHPHFSLCSMVQCSACLGRPRKYHGGWETSNTKIYVTRDTLENWRELRRKLDFSSDNLLAIYLLKRNEDLMKIEETADSPNDR